MIFPVPASFRSMVEKAGFVQYVKHAFEVGGYKIVDWGTLALDDLGLEFVRTYTLYKPGSGYQVKIVQPDDLIEALGGHPTVEQIVAIYGKPVGYEHAAYKEFLKYHS